MQLRHVKGAVPFFAILGVSSFALIFLLKVSLSLLLLSYHVVACYGRSSLRCREPASNHQGVSIHIVSNSNLPPNMKSWCSYQESRWGQIPGSLNYTNKKNITFYSLQSDFLSQIQNKKLMPEAVSLVTQDSLHFDLSRNYTNITYIPSVSRLFENLKMVYSKLQSRLESHMGLAWRRETPLKATVTSMWLGFQCGTKWQTNLTSIRHLRLSQKWDSSLSKSSTLRPWLTKPITICSRTRKWLPSQSSGSSRTTLWPTSSTQMRSLEWTHLTNFTTGSQLTRASPATSCTSSLKSTSRSGTFTWPTPLWTKSFLPKTCSARSTSLKRVCATNSTTTIAVMSSVQRYFGSVNGATSPYSQTTDSTSLLMSLMFQASKKLILRTSSVMESTHTT